MKDQDIQETSTQKQNQNSTPTLTHTHAHTQPSINNNEMQYETLQNLRTSRGALRLTEIKLKSTRIINVQTERWHP